MTADTPESRGATRLYLVCSPPYDYTEPVLDYGEGPTTTERDVLVVRCRTRSRARVLALRAWRRRFRTGRDHWQRYYLSDSAVHPFSGMTVEPYEVSDV